MIFGVISISLAGTSHAFTVPDGWRVPSRNEYMNEVRKRESKDYLAVQGDFNGDDVSDEARLCVTEDGKNGDSSLDIKE